MVQYLQERIADTRVSPVKRKAIRIGKDAAAQGFARMFGVPTKLPGQDDEGYGDKITSDKQVLVNNRWYRVYVTCYGNASSSWIMYQGSKRFLL